MEIVNRKKERLSDNGGSSRIGEVHDELLINILCRLPCETIDSCRYVSKEWLSLISNPIFVDDYLLHHKTSLPPDYRSFMRTVVKKETQQHEHEFITMSADDGKLLLPNLSLNFLPHHPSSVKVAATFTDLVLCYSDMNEDIEYYICNPLTRLWVTLPPPPPLRLHPSDENCFVALICQDPPPVESLQHQHYRFRVVVMIFPSLEVTVFCSEIGQWKNMFLRQTPIPTSADDEIKSGLEGVVYNKIVYFAYNTKFGKSSISKFDPFRVTSMTRDGDTLAVPPLRPLRYLGHVKLAECRGRLQAISVTWDRALNMWELQENGRKWKYKGKAFLAHLNTGFLSFRNGVDFEVAGVHQKKDNENEVCLLVKHNDYRQELVVSQWNLFPAIKPLTSSPPQQGSFLFAHHRLDLLLPSPTPLPLIRSL